MTETHVIENEEQFREYLAELGASQESIEKGMSDVSKYLENASPDDQSLYPFELEEVDE